MTENKDLSIMEKAEAIITLEGGPSSHAAIMCRMKGFDVLLNAQATYPVMIIDDGLWCMNKYYDFGSDATLNNDTFVIEAN